ncbi:MAG: hypothetical protein LBM13_03415 [Candidatus Ancillula sp.]|jgi:uncharacterized protein YpmB|nr:hypothetical protein [Candidatus Ancillula sp.]
MRIEKKISIVLIVFALVLSLSFAFQSIAKADTKTDSQDSISVTVSPATNEINLTPGVDYTAKLKVTNTGATPFKIYVSAAPYRISDEGYDVDFETKDKFSQMADWFSFEYDKDRVLAPKEDMEVTYIIHVPENAEVGGQYAAVFVDTEDTDSANGDSVQVAKRVGSLIFANLGGAKKYGGDVRQDIKWWYMYPFINDDQAREQNIDIDKDGAKTFAYITNSGNIHNYATYQLKVSSLWNEWFGNGYTWQSDPVSKLVLPGTTRKFVIPWENDKFGIYFFTQTVQFGNGSNGIPSRFQDTSWTFVCPLLWVIIAIVIIVLLIILLIVRHYQKKKKQQKKLKEAEKQLAEEDAEVKEFLDSHKEQLKKELLAELKGEEGKDNLEDKTGDKEKLDSKKEQKIVDKDDLMSKYL